MNQRFISLTFCAAVLFLTSRVSSQAQWITQEFALKGGWNAVYLNVDPSHLALEELLQLEASSPIQEVWLWKPEPATRQFVESPQVPVNTGSQWASWTRSAGPSSTLQRLVPNAAYLVHVNSTVASYIWRVKGKPTVPRNEWTSGGLNFLGFSTPTANPPNFEAFFAAGPVPAAQLDIFRYQGGDLGSENPKSLNALRTTSVRRGEAFWLRARQGENYNSYAGPFEVTASGSGVHFGEQGGQARLRLRNTTTGVLTVTLHVVPSEPAPAGQTPIALPPPLLLRGEQNTTNLTYGHSDPAVAPPSWMLQPKGQPGAEVEIVLGLNRTNMAGAPSDFFAAVLRFTDDLQLSQMDLPVSAKMSSSAGLWVGQALVTQVRHYLKIFDRDSAGRPILGEDGAYESQGINRAFGTVARPFSLRLIVHHDAGGTAHLLQRVFVGPDKKTAATVLATSEDALDPAQLASARRISATHLPWTAGNTPWQFQGVLRQGQSLIATVQLPFDEQSSSPFLHTYHPDHDNRDALFEEELPRGWESYDVTRTITLTVTTPPGDFDALTRANTTLMGEYAETITYKGRDRPHPTEPDQVITETRVNDVLGAFALTRISEINTLTTANP